MDYEITAEKKSQHKIWNLPETFLHLSVSLVFSRILNFKCSKNYQNNTGFQKKIFVLFLTAMLIIVILIFLMLIFMKCLTCGLVLFPVFGLLWLALLSVYYLSHKIPKNWIQIWLVLDFIKFLAGGLLNLSITTSLTLRLVASG